MMQTETPELSLPYKMALAALSLLLFFGAAELLCRVFYRPADNLSLILDVLERDSSLIWKNRPGLDRDFQGVAVKTDSSGFRTMGRKSSGAARIVCMGASPDFGWGVTAGDAYSSQLEKLLNSSGGKYEVINAGMIGHSSAQGLVFLKEKVLPLKPAIVTIPYAVNDVDRHRFFRDSAVPDNELKPLGRPTVVLLNLADRSRFLAWYRHVALSSLALLPAKPAQYSPHVRVPKAYYEANLRAMAQAVTAAGARPVFIAMPVRPPGEGYVFDEAVRARSASFSEDGFKALQAGDLTGAKIALERAVSADVHNPAPYFYLAQLAGMRGDKDGSAGYGKKMLEAELYSCARESGEYNAIMRRVARDMRVPLVDAAALLSSGGSAPAAKFYVNPAHDFVHPNAEGHAIIAGALYSIITDRDGKGNGQ